MIDLRKSAELNGMEPMELYSWFKRYPRSNKRVICYCDICGKEREITYCAYHDLCSKCANNTPETHRKRHDSAVKRFSDPIECEKASIRTTEHFENNPEAREEASRITTEYYSHQENRDRQSVVKNEYYSHQKNRDAFGIISTEYWSHQENRDDQAERTRQYNKDYPETPEMLIERSKRISAGHQGIPYDEWEDFVPDRVDRRTSPQIKQWRSDIFERDNYTCQICYQCGNLNGHHIKKWGEYPELRYDINNGITLCVDCHLETYGKEDEYIDFLQKRIDQKVYIE